MMMQEFQGNQNRDEGRLEEHVKRVAQVIGSEARDALRGQRIHMFLEHQVLVQTGEREDECPALRKHIYRVFRLLGWFLSSY